MASPNNKKVAKVAFCFLTLENVSQPKLWHHFFATKKNQNEIYKNVYIHNKSSFIDTEFGFHDHCIDESLRVPTQWGHKSLVAATLQLFRQAYDHDQENAFFILLSGNCVPLYGLETISNHILEIGTNIMGHCIYDCIQDADGVYRYSNILDPEFFDTRQFHKQSQWMVLDRKTVQFFLENSFLHLFSDNLFCLDEHYFINIMLKYNIPCYNEYITFFNFGEKSDDEMDRSIPKTYVQLTNEMVDNIAYSQSMFMRKISPKCVLPSYFDSIMSGDHHHHQQQQQQYNIVIQTMVRDEEHILNEWILHHLLLGFEHIYIYDDQSVIPVATTIQVLPHWAKTKITVVFRNECDFYDQSAFQKNAPSSFYREELYKRVYGNKQQYFQNHFLQNFQTVSKWCFFCDVDEFLVLAKKQNIAEFIDALHWYDCIYIPWIMYGSSFQVNQGGGDDDSTGRRRLVMDTFTYHSDKYDVFGKSICKLSSIKWIHSTHVLYDLRIIAQKKILNIDPSLPLYTHEIHINHYNKLSAKLFWKRRMRHEVGHRRGEMRPFSQIFSLSFTDNTLRDGGGGGGDDDDDNENCMMQKYSAPIRSILFPDHASLPSSSPSPPPSSRSFCDIALWTSCTTTNIATAPIIYKWALENERDDDARNTLNDLLADPQLRYCYWDEILPGQFDATVYKTLYPHLQCMSDNEARAHYVQHGRSEGLIHHLDDLPVDFDAAVYKSLYPHLQCMSDMNACVHFIQHGRPEGLIYNLDDLPADFDVNVYKQTYPHLQCMSDMEACVHFVRYGRSEGLLYKYN